MKLAPILTELSRCPPLTQNPVYNYLKVELDRLEQENSSCSELSMASLLVKNLSSLLNELTLTQDPKLQLTLLYKIRSWYSSKLPRTLEDLQIKNENTELPIGSQCKTPQPRLPLQTPSPTRSTNECSIYEINRLKSSHFSNINYLHHIKQLSTKFSEWESSRSKLNEELSFKGTIKKKPKRIKINKSSIEKPRWKERIEDLRIYSNFSNGRFDSSQKLKEQLTTIESIKNKLANKKLAVSSKCLENGISLYTEKDLNSSQAFPNSGETLLKLPKFISGEAKKTGKRKKSPKRLKKSKKK